MFGMEKQDNKKRLHPTQKPLELCNWFITRYSKDNSNILDLFGGSGSTLIACEQLNRKCYMMELDPKYIDVIINRWEQYTGEKAILLNGDK
jgi:site-specific DNA-methyltransferase (adenine-specific)